MSGRDSTTDTDRIMDAPRRYVCLRCKSDYRAEVKIETEREMLEHLRWDHDGENINDGKYDYSVIVGNWPDSGGDDDE